MLFRLINTITGLSESQSLWINSFEDYVDDFVYFVTMVSKEHSHLQVCQ